MESVKKIGHKWKIARESLGGTEVDLSEGTTIYGTNKGTVIRIDVSREGVVNENKYCSEDRYDSSYQECQFVTIGGQNAEKKTSYDGDVPL